MKLLKILGLRIFPGIFHFSMGNGRVETSLNESMWGLKWFEHAGEKTKCAGIVLKLQSVGVLVLIWSDIYKNIQDNTAALENCGKLWKIWCVAGLSWWKCTVQFTSTQNFSFCLTGCIISRYCKAWLVNVVYFPESKNRDCCLHSGSVAAQPTTLQYW
jgi:hypothetical protein